MNVLSLFDGMSCGQLTLRELGIPVTNYFASEIDKHAMSITQHNFPNTIQLGDVRNVKAEDLPQIDLLLGGSPCQGFSVGGLRANLEDPRSALYFEFERLVKECKPKYFLLENVIMEDWPKEVITTRLGYESIELCGSAFSAIRRPRLYWSNIPIKPVTDYNTDVISDIIDADTVDNSDLTHPLTVNDLKHQPEWQIREGTTYLSWNHSHKTNTEWPQSKRANYLHAKALTLCTKDLSKVILKDNNTIRKMSVSELERGHGIPVGYTSCASRAQAVHAMGNGWHIDVIKHILGDLSKLFTEPQFAPRCKEQGRLFPDPLLSRQIP